MVDPMSPRLASAMTRRPASRAAASTDSRAPTPAEPRRSKNATCGLTTGTTPAKASTQRRPNERSPSAESGRPQRSSSSGDGSMPAHSGPVRATAEATASANPTTGTGSAMGHACQLAHPPDTVARAPAFDLTQDPERGPRVAEGRRADLNGVGPGHQQFDRILTAHHAAHTDDGGVRIGGPDVEDGAHGGGV